MKKIVSVFLMAAFIAGSPMAKAGSESKDEKLTVSVKEVPATSEEIYGEAFNPIRDDSFNPADVGSYVDIGELIMIGNALINIIKAGEPVVNIKTDVIHVVPAGIADWRGLSNWHAGPAFKIYNVQVTSKIRGVVADIRLKLTTNYGGAYQKMGQYIANLVMVPTKVEVKWNVDLDVWSEAGTPINIASAENPMAGIPFVMTYKAHFKYGVGKKVVEGSKDYFVQGDGVIKEEGGTNGDDQDAPGA